MKRRSGRRKAQVAHLQVTFESGPGHVVAVFDTGEISTIGLRFESIEQMITFFTGLMTEAAKVWPEHEMIKYYKEDEDANPQ